MKKRIKHSPLGTIQVTKYDPNEPWTTLPVYWLKPDDIGYIQEYFTDDVFEHSDIVYKNKEILHVFENYMQIHDLIAEEKTYEVDKTHTNNNYFSMSTQIIRMMVVFVTNLKWRFK